MKIFYVEMDRREKFTIECRKDDTNGDDLQGQKTIRAPAMLVTFLTVHLHYMYMYMYYGTLYSEENL